MEQVQGVPLATLPVCRPSLHKIHSAHVAKCPSTGQSDTTQNISGDVRAAYLKDNWKLGGAGDTLSSSKAKNSRQEGCCCSDATRRTGEATAEQHCIFTHRFDNLVKQVRFCAIGCDIREVYVYCRLPLSCSQYQGKRAT